MKKHIIAFLLCSLSALAQQPAIAWQKTYGGTGSDGLFSTCQTTDGGYIVSGSTYSVDGDMTENFGEGDGWLAKLDAAGNIEWQKSYGGNHDDLAYKVAQTPEGGYIFAGYSQSTQDSFAVTHGGGDIWVVKTDALGNVQWQKLLGGSSYDWANDITLATDGGFVVAGQSLSQDGDITQSHGGHDYWIIKLNPEGDIVWQKTYGGSLTDSAYGIENTNDGGYIVSGATESNDGDVTGFHYTEDGPITLDAWILKLDTDGNLQWQKALGGYQDDMAYTIKQTADGGYITAAQTSSSDGDVSVAFGSFDSWILKLDATGNITWQKSLGGAGYDESHGITETTDGYVAAGMSYSTTNTITTTYGGGDARLTKLGLNGDLVWEKNFGGTQTDYIYDIFTNTAGNFVMTGYTYSTDIDVTSNHGIADGWLVSVSPNVLSLPDNTLQESYLYPNPATDVIRLTNILQSTNSYRITDMTGKEVATGSGLENIIVKQLTSGTYILTTADGQSKKFIKK